MKIRVREIDLLNLSSSDLAEVNTVIMESDSASIFHTVEWNRILIEEFNLCYVALLATFDEKPVGLYIYFPLLDNTYQSPAINLQSVYGGPIAVMNNPDVISELLLASEKKEQMAIFKVWTSPKIDPLPFVLAGYETREMYTPIMKLNGSQDERWLRLKRDKRYKIRKAIKNGAVLVEAEVKDLPIYRELVSKTSAQFGMEPFSLTFYNRLLEELVPIGNAKLFFIKVGEMIVSSTIILYCKDMVYGWELGWRREYTEFSPNDFLVWSIAQNAYERGFKYFDLLRIEPDRLPGIAKWKESFRADIETCYFLQKKTFEYRLFHPLKTLFTNPRKVITKVQESLLNDGEK